MALHTSIFAELGLQDIPYCTSQFCMPSLPWSGNFLAMSGPYSTPYFLMPVQPTPTVLHRRVSPDGESQAAKRARASKPKVKSGCITCKTRRVKCDETKPHCRRCQKFGRDCDGYPEPSLGRSTAILPIQPRIPQVSVYSPSVSIHTSEDESRYFQSFIDHSANELSGFFDSSFWSRLVLQESHLIPPIRHAVIAIGALNKSLETAPGPGLKVNVIQTINKKHHEAAVAQYLKAIQALNNYLTESDSPQLRTALVACLLFICFETFLGSFAASVQQTYGGLKILRSYYQGKPGSKPWIPRRCLAEASSRAATSATISKNLQNRLGCDSVSKASAISQHLNEYLEGEGGLKTDSSGHTVPVNKSFIYDPNTEQRHHATQNNPAQGQQRILKALPARKRVEYPSDVEDGQIRELTYSTITPEASRKISATSNSTQSSDSSHRKDSTFSISLTSTPVTYTLPSPGPHTPSPSNTLTNNARKRPLVSRSPTPPPLHNDFAIEEILIQTFVRLDGQGLFFGMTPGIPPLIWDIHRTWHLPIPSSFPTFATAHRCWDFLQDRALQFYRRTLFNRFYAPGSADPESVIAEEYERYLDQLDQFAAAYQPLFRAAFSPDGQILHPATVLLSLYHKTTLITLSAVPSTSELAYDVHLPHFRSIVQHARPLIAHSAQQPRFTFDVGIVPPLFVTATKCRDPGVRREAIELLFACPRQEGMWDGVLSARIGRWVMGCEEEGLDIQGMQVPDSNTGFGSRQSSVSVSTSKASSPKSTSGRSGRNGYPSPPALDKTENRSSVGGVEDGRSFGDAIHEPVGSNALSEINGNYLGSKSGLGSKAGSTAFGRRKSVGKAKGKDVARMPWIVPEENRVRLMSVDFHIPERYILVKCQKSLPATKGTGEERETVIAW